MPTTYSIVLSRNQLTHYGLVKAALTYHLVRFNSINEIPDLTFGPMLVDFVNEIWATKEEMWLNYGSVKLNVVFENTNECPSVYKIKFIQHLHSD